MLCEIVPIHPLVSLLFCPVEFLSRWLLLPVIQSNDRPQNRQSLPCVVAIRYKRAGGKLRIDWVGGPEVIKSFDQVLALKAGTIDMLPACLGAFSAPDRQSWRLPFLDNVSLLSSFRHGGQADFPQFPWTERCTRNKKGPSPATKPLQIIC